MKRSSRLDDLKLQQDNKSVHLVLCLKKKDNKLINSKTAVILVQPFFYYNFS